jgi:hypothetical protein
MPLQKSETEQQTQQNFLATFRSSHLREPFNRKAALYLQQSVLNKDPDALLNTEEQGTPVESARNAVNKLLEASQGRDFINVTYEKGARSGGIGRWFAKNAPSIQRMPRKVRHTLCRGIWLDIDFVNCHPVLLQQMCRKEGIPCQHLARYNKSREDMLLDIVQFEGSTFNRDNAKKAILKALNGGHTEGINVDWWPAMCAEFKSIAHSIANLECHSKKRKNALQRDMRNIDARTMNLALCSEENRCLEQLYNLLFENNCIIDRSCVLIFDGIQILDTPRTRELVCNCEFLEKASRFIMESAGWQLSIKVKDFDEGYALPEGYDSDVVDCIVIESGDDKTAAEEFLKLHCHRLARCRDHTFWLQDGVYIHNAKAVREALVSCISEMNICVRGRHGLTQYSRSLKHAEDCAQMVLSNTKIIRNDFIEHLWNSNLGYLAFDNGVFSFQQQSLLQTPEELDNICFTMRIPRQYPAVIDPDVLQALMDRVLIPILPDAQQRNYFLHCVSRALAGEVFDKRWYVLIGERNSGKGVLCLLLELAFGGFVQTINAENLLCARFGNGDTAKKQSWMSPLEFVRVAFSNEVSGDVGRIKIDGNMVKRMASGGDSVEVRTNYKDEERKKLQCTMFLCCNEFPQIAPADAYETLEVFNFQTKFVDQETFESAGPKRQRHWMMSDPGLKKWIRQPEVVDAFTHVVLKAYTSTRLLQPECVKQDITNFKGPAAEDIVDRIKEVVVYSPNENDKVFTEQIKLCLEQAGLETMTSYKIEEYVRRLYGQKRFPPQRQKYQINGQRGIGYNHICLVDIPIFNGSLERRTRNEQCREEARQAAKRKFGCL